MHIIRRILFLLLLCIIVSCGCTNAKVDVSAKSTTTAKPTPVSMPMPSATPTPIPQATPEQIKAGTQTDKDEKISKAMKQAADQGIVAKIAKSGEIYNPKEAVIFKESMIMCCVEGFRAFNNDITYSKGGYCLAVDFSVGNESQNDEYLSNVYNFILTDSRSYSYNPSPIQGRGSLNGIIKPGGDMRRGEIVFEVPASERDFQLTFNLDKDSVKCATFNINVKM